MQIFKKPNINFMKYKFLAFGLSGIIIISGILNFTSGKGLNSGVDFAGGTLIRLKFKYPVPISELRQSLRNENLGTSKIQEIERGQREYIIRAIQASEEAEQELEAHEIIGNKIIEALRAKDDKLAIEQGFKDLNSLDKKELTNILKTSFPDEAPEIASKIISFRVKEGIIRDFAQLQQETDVSKEAIECLQENTFVGNLTILSKETVGPQVGHDLRRKAIQATIWALIGMLIYIGIRFKFAYGISAILTLGHDVLITMTIFSFSNREINMPVIAAIMTIVGYSLNDTIVIFDRVRDNLKSLRKHPFQEVLNISINQTLSRTVITSGTTLMTVVAIYLFGGEVINDFAFTMIIGVIVGTYSSIYQSCSYLHFWKKIFKPKKGMGK